MTRKLLTIFAVATVFSRMLPAQGADTRTRPNDWEEINFEFNQAVLTDGFPSLLRLADLLKQHPDYKRLARIDITTLFR